MEPEPYLRRQARLVRDASVAVRVSDGSAEAFPLADESCDGAVTSLVLCSVSDQPAALAEIQRVLRPGGQLRLYEHVIAESDRGATLQRSLDRSGVWPRLAAGCHLARYTLAAIQAAGFDIEHCRRSQSGPLVIPHVLGMARRP